MTAAALNRRTRAALAVLSGRSMIPVGAAAATTATTTSIVQVQGTGDTSPLSGRTVTTSVW